MTGSIRPLAAWLGATIVLFIWSGLSQALPWGPSSAGRFAAFAGKPFVPASDATVHAPPGAWVTDRFEQDFPGRVITLATDRSFNWIVSIPASDYRLPRYFVCEAITQAAVALALTKLLAVLHALPKVRQLATVAGFAFAAGVATHGQLMNWWGVPAAYAMGAMANLLVGWTLAAAWIMLLREHALDSRPRH